MMPLGTKARDFSLLNVIDGKPFSLEAVKGKNALLVMFICRHCPYVQHVKNELAKIGVKLIEKGQVYKLDCSEKQVSEKVFINTYDDHRMAMAFAPLALIIPELEIEDADVVEKSYPAFWRDLETVGFEINGLNDGRVYYSFTEIKD